MDMTKIDEKWIDLPRVKRNKNSIVSISNTGKYRRLDGTEGVLELRHGVKYHGNKKRCYRVIAENFLITVKRPDQDCVDHISHTPSQYHVNNVLNLRWCTKAENNGFEEARKNMSIGMKGIRIGAKNPMWKGDDVSPQRKYRRARKLYNAGKISEEEFQHYRDGWAKYQRQRRIAMKTLSES